MTTLQAIGFTAGVGSIVGVSCLVGFGLALRARSTNVAPRCTARSPDTIYAVHPRNAAQARQRGTGPFLGWVGWSLRLSYDTLLRGVPGTGTRADGMKGNLLRSNLDGIIMLRFHSICLRVATLTAVLVLGIVLPLNLTANCYENDQFTDPDQCFDPNQNKEVLLTNYERTTIANIPPVVKNVNGTTINLSIDTFRKAIWAGYPYSLILSRLYVIVLCSWVVYWYTCSLLKNEWKEALALRRVYYLENDVWQRRKKELGETVLLPTDYWSDEGSDDSDGENGNHELEDEASLTKVGFGLKDDDTQRHQSTGSNSGRRLAQFLKSRGKDQMKGAGVSNGALEGGNGGIYIPSRHAELLRPGPGVRRRTTSTSSTALDQPPAVQNDANGSHSLPKGEKTEEDVETPKLRKVKKRTLRRRRDPWIPNPEMRDTVPNIELYSVLVGDIPRLPSEVVRESNVEGADGYTPRQALDWQLAVVSAFFNQCVPNQPGFSSSVAAVTILPDAADLGLAWRKWYAAAAALRRLKFIRRLMMELRERQEDASIEAQEEGHIAAQEARGASPPFGVNKNATNESSWFISADIPFRSNPNVFSSRQFFGLNDDLEVESRLFHAWNYGPEQTAMYSRELAQGASNCCPNGCCEGRLRRIQQIDQLMELEEEALIRVHEAHIELADAREKAAVNVLPCSRPSPEHLQVKTCDQVRCGKVRGALGADSGNRNGAIERKRRRSWHASNEASQSMPRESHHVKSRTAFDGNVPLPASLGVEALLLAKCGGDDQHAPPLSTPPQIATETPPMNNLSKKPANNIRSENENTPLIRSQKQDLNPNSCAGNGAYVSVSSNISSAKVERASSRAAACRPSALKPGVSPTSNEQGPATPNRHHNFSARSELSAISFGSFPRRSYIECQGGRQMSLDSEGKIVMRRFVSFPSERSDKGNMLPHNMEESDCESAILLDVGVGLNQSNLSSDDTLSRRRAAHAASGSMEANGDLQHDNRWSQVQTIRRQQSYRNLMRSLRSTSSEDAVGTGVWNLPSPRNALRSTCSIMSNAVKKFIIKVKGCTASKTHKVVHEIKSKSTFAVVTFTSRQSAVAARHCLSDGRGGKRWMTIDHVVVPPLADAGSCDLVTCRGCLRPVTLSINRNQQLCRRIVAFVALFTIYTFWTVPFTFVASFCRPENLETYLPHLGEKTTEQFRRFFFALTGLIPGLLQTAFIAVCPMLFRTIANSGSNAHSFAGAEGSALKYYWWFMVFTAFSGTSLLTMVLNGINNGTSSISFTGALVEIANSIPTQVSSVWINWIILRSTATLPSQYMLQFNAFLFDFLGWQCCKRAVLGGGPGADIPYRVYVDSGVVFMCTVALSFASPLVAPCAMLCLLISVPILRRNCVFVYRPKFDGGGFRWPFLFDIFISSMVLGQVLLATMVLLKQAVGPALLAIAPLGPTLVFRGNCRKRFYRAYRDAGLLQTSLLDGWDEEVPTTIEKREDFRRFLVDAHKAAYIPVCIAGDDATSVLSSEPAVAVPSEFDAVPRPASPVDNHKRPHTMMKWTPNYV